MNQRTGMRVRSLEALCEGLEILQMWALKPGPDGPTAETSKAAGAPAHYGALASLPAVKPVISCQKSSKPQEVLRRLLSCGMTRSVYRWLKEMWMACPSYPLQSGRTSRLKPMVSIRQSKKHSDVLHLKDQPTLAPLGVSHRC